MPLQTYTLFPRAHASIKGGATDGPLSSSLTGTTDWLTPGSTALVSADSLYVDYNSPDGGELTEPGNGQSAILQLSDFRTAGGETLKSLADLATAVDAVAWSGDGFIDNASPFEQLWQVSSIVRNASIVSSLMTLFTQDPIVPPGLNGHPFTNKGIPTVFGPSGVSAASGLSHANMLTILRDAAFRLSILTSVTGEPYTFYYDVLRLVVTLDMPGGTLPPRVPEHVPILTTLGHFGGGPR